MTLNSKLLSNTQVGKLTRKISQVTKHDGGTITVGDVKQLLNKMEGVAKGKQAKFVVMGLAPTGYVQIKAYNSDAINDGTWDDYLDGRVKSTAKFKEFAQLKVYTYT